MFSFSSNISHTVLDNNTNMYVPLQMAKFGFVQYMAEHFQPERY